MNHSLDYEIKNLHNSLSTVLYLVRKQTPTELKSSKDRNLDYIENKLMDAVLLTRRFHRKFPIEEPITEYKVIELKDESPKVLIKYAEIMIDKINKFAMDYNKHIYETFDKENCFLQVVNSAVIAHERILEQYKDK